MNTPYPYTYSRMDTRASTTHSTPTLIVRDANNHIPGHLPLPIFGSILNLLDSSSQRQAYSKRLSICSDHHSHPFTASHKDVPSIHVARRGLQQSAANIQIIFIMQRIYKVFFEFSASFSFKPHLSND
jgi:hypothetical protein